MDKSETIELDETEVEDAETVDQEAEDIPADDENEEAEEATDGENEEEQGEDEESDDKDEDDEATSDEKDPDAVEVVIGSADDEEETPVIRTLRKKLRDEAKQRKELEKKLEDRSSQEKAAELGPKPTLAEFDYDEEKFAASLEGWNERKRAIDAEKERQQKAVEAFNAEWQEKRAAYDQRKKEIGIPDFEDTVEAQFRDAFDAQQQSVVIDVCRNPEYVMLALSQNEDLATRLAGEKNPVRLAAEIVRLESKMKVTGAKPTTKPEKRPASTRVARSGSSQLEKLREEAAKTGDYTKVNAYRKQARSKS